LGGIVKKSLFPRRSDGGARREVREPAKIKVEDYEGEGESPGEGTPLYKSYMYVPPLRVGFLLRFGLKTGIDCPYFGLESGYGFRGNYGSL